VLVGQVSHCVVLQLKRDFADDSFEKSIFHLGLALKLATAKADGLTYP